MDFIIECFEEHSSALTESLIGAQFSIDQARQFLPEAAFGILESTEKTGVFQTISCLLSNSPTLLLRRLDVDSIAKRTGMNCDKVTVGLHAIAPILLQACSQKSDAVNSTASH